MQSTERMARNYLEHHKGSAGLGRFEPAQDAPRRSNQRVMRVFEYLHTVEPVGIAVHRLPQRSAERHAQLGANIEFADIRALRQRRALGIRNT